MNTPSGKSGPPQGRAPSWQSRHWRMLSLLVALTLGITGALFFREKSGPVSATPPVLNTKEFDPAVAALMEQTRNGVLISPRSADAWGRMGMMLLAHEVRSEAADCFSQAATLAPEEPRWPYYLGIAQLADAPLTAVTNLDRAVRLFAAHWPEPPAPRLRLADALLSLGRIDEAEAHYRQAWKQNPNSASAAFGLGKIANARDRASEAADFLAKATNHPSTRKAAHRLLVGVYERVGRTNEVEQLSQTLAKLANDTGLPDPVFAEVEKLKTGLNQAIDRADELINAGRVPDAVHLLESTLQSYPNSDRAYFFLGRARLRQGNLAGAEQMLVRSLQLAPSSVEAMVQLGIIQLAQRRTPDAQKSFRAAIAAKPNLPEAWYNLGLSIGGQNRAESMAAFREAIRLKPNFIEAYLALAVVLRADGQAEAADMELRRALALNPEEPLRQKVVAQLDRTRK
jgi:tetratricopeptide (TPR) repeat protein